MSNYSNVTVFLTSNDSKIATGASANIVDDGEGAQVWGGTFTTRPVAGNSYRLTSGGLLDWTGTFNSGSGTQQSPYTFSVTDSERERRAAAASRAV